MRRETDGERSPGGSKTDGWRLSALGLGAGSIIHFQAARQMHIYTFPKHSLLFKFT